MVDAVHQVIPTLSDRDAIGMHTLEAQRVLRGMGLESEIYAGVATPSMRRHARPLRRFRTRARGRTFLLYQSSTGSPVGDWVAQRREPLLVDYHNITPAEYYDPWEPHVGAELRRGRRQLAALAERCVLGLADSEYNRAELDDFGFASSVVVPILVDLASFDHEVDRAALARLARAKERGGADWLFVGRLSPNKAQHDVIAAFALYRRTLDPRARLHLVGGASSPHYLQALERYAARLGVGDAVELCGSIPPGELAARYRVADVFVCLSDHEGFCVPLLEAMHQRVPIVAYGATAVPETVGGAGLVLPSKRPALVAHAVHRVLTDDALRCTLVQRGAERVRDFDLTVTTARFTAAVEQALAAA